MRIALDAMGGDHAPLETVAGALRALDEDADLEVALVGREDVIRRRLDEEGRTSDHRLTVVHAEQVISASDGVEALRSKRDSSIARAVGLVKTGEAGAVVSAGNTGAVVGSATLTLRMVPGVRRAGIAVALGTRDRFTVLIDVGANIHCRPEDLLNYGVMGAAYAGRVLGATDPRVALLNIGTEEEKGNELVKETKRLFQAAPFNFIGHVEGNDLFAGVADVIVCEGFVGNVVLKTSEGLSERMHQRFEEIVGRIQPDGPAGELIHQFRLTTDYAEIGGAVLMGVNGNCLISHGRSDRRAIGNALKLAARFVRAGVREAVAAELETREVVRRGGGELT